MTEITQNGVFPPGSIVETYLYYPGTTNGRYLRKDVAPHAEAMALAFMFAFDKPLYATDGARDLATQWVVWRKWQNGTGAPAAEPGTSNHGEARALDLASNINHFSSPEHKWMRANAHKFGFVHPSWARQGGGREEAWHWEYEGGGATHPRLERPGKGEVGLGSKGEAAREAQRLLNKNLRPENRVTVDGDFGLMSAFATAKYQRSRGLAVNGVIGPVTKARLGGKEAEPTKRPEKDAPIYLQKGTKKADQVKTLQAFLNRAFPKVNRLKVDGDYGDATEAAVKHWQDKAGLVPTGTIGPKSRDRLIELGVDL